MAPATMQGKWLLSLDGQSLPEKSLIGGKGWSIAHMLRKGLPVPPAIVITTEACTSYLASGALPEGLEEELAEGIAWLEQQTGRTFGNGSSPLLVSVRSGAPISMPGMMDTVLNLGINDETMQALAQESGDQRFARDTYRRFYELYGSVVLKIPTLELPDDEDLQQWRSRIEEKSGKSLPGGPREQLRETVEAVFKSWNSRRARRYRQHHDIPDDLGTAVTIQAMVFGNLDSDSGTGVLFSRNPLTGENEPYGEYLRCAQGEDVVSGKHTPTPLADMKASAPEAYEQLMTAANILERENRDVQDIEFTVQKGKLYLLQSRNAKRSPLASVRIAVDMCAAGDIDRSEAVRRVTADQIRTILSPRLAETATLDATVIASGLGASHGVGTGVVVTSADEAEQRAASGEDVVLVTATTSPDDVHGMIVARAIVTESGGSTSHAAVVSRALGRPAIVGCGEGTLRSLAGKTVTVDGDNGKVYEGSLEVQTTSENDDERLRLLLDWAADISPIKVYRPADAPADTLILDGNDAAADPDNLPALLQGCNGAQGGAIASNEGVRAALQAGLSYIVADPLLPALLTAIQVNDALSISHNDKR